MISSMGALAVLGPAGLVERRRPRYKNRRTAKGRKAAMAKLTLKDAQTIVERALAKGHEARMKPLTVAVLDARGCLVAYAMEDGGLLRQSIATGKAWGALGMGRSSRGLEQMAKDRPHFIAAAIEASAGRLVPVPGGVLVRAKDGELIGAVGVSGDTSDNDEIAAKAGIEAAGLVAEI
jgi:uncharacterized protein GlcG (DUF336 family)